MDEHVEALLRKLVAEQSDNGRNMEDIRWSNREEIAYWLGQHYDRVRSQQATVIMNAERFQFRVDHEARVVYVRVLDGSSWRQLIDFKEDGEGS